MAFTARYLSHPQVSINPHGDVREWSLNSTGRSRVIALAESQALAGTAQVISSAEVKAIETASPLAEALGCPLRVVESMHENDRTATGFLPPEEFEKVADQFFAAPAVSVRGWETALHAQSRIVREVDQCLTSQGTGDVLFVGHGGVGTLLLCSLLGVPVSRVHDQGPGGGNYFQFSIATRIPLCGWTPMEALIPGPD